VLSSLVLCVSLAFLPILYFVSLASNCLFSKQLTIVILLCHFLG